MGYQDDIHSIRYEYDFEGIRQAQIVDGQVTEYLVDHNREFAEVLEERDAAGSLRTSYCLSDRDRISTTSLGQTRYFHQDGLGSIRTLSDEQGEFSDSGC